MHLLRREIRRIACLAAWAAVSLPAFGSYAQVSSPVETLKRRDAALRAVDGSTTEAVRDSLVRQSVVSGFDFERHSRISLGRYWRERTAAEREEFVSVLRLWTENRALEKLRKRSDNTTYDGEETRGSRSLVRTTVWYKGTKTLVDYKMELKQGEWLIYDMVIDGASVALANRDAFYKKIRQSSYEELLSTLRAKTLETE
ncbi:MAG: ABC transporter substrate-binding protein [Gemmatimonadetes bacterium]|nr:ABC transporter substrate-binding protein [Gemmatimonadota bacterium]